MTQDPPKREHWQHQQGTDSGARKAMETAALKPTPETAAPPARRPPELTTSSIAPPEAGLATRMDPDARPVETPDATDTALWTTEKVKMRKEATTSSSVVTTLKGGQSVTVLASEGKWKKVSAGGRTGWVRDDFLAKADDLPAVAIIAPRPKSDVGLMSKPAKTQTASAATPMSDWGALRPARAPQGGDCQCPYDLMLNGKQCGDHSAYAKGRDASCFF